MHRSFKYFFPLWTMLSTRVQADLIHDYFNYKNLSRLTLFSCGQTESKYYCPTETLTFDEFATLIRCQLLCADDFSFVKRMNAVGFSVVVISPNFEVFDASTPILRNDNSAVGIILDTRCQTRAVNEKIIAQSTKYRLYESIHVWLILGTSLKKISRLVNDSAYSLLTDVVVGVENLTGWDLHDIYNPCKIRGGILNITKFGRWNPKEGLEVSLTQSKFARRSNLHEMRIKVLSVVKYQPAGKKIEDHLQDYTMKSQDPVSKYGYGIVRQLAELFNFTMEIRAVGEWIAVVNDTEIGAMPILHRGEADVLASPASASLRFAAKPYGRILMPGYPYRTFFILRTNIEKIKWTEHLNPLALDSWFAITITSIIFVGTITVIQIMEYREGWFAEAGHTIFGALGVLCQQGLISVPNRLAGRVAFLFLLFYATLLSNYYAASVVGARLKDPVDKMNDSLYSLAKSHMNLASEDYRNIDDNLASRGLNEWEVRYFNEKVWLKLPMSRYAPIEESLDKVLRGGYAYHTSPEVAYPYVEKHWDEKAICDLTEIHVITPRVMSFWERIDSPFTELMRVGLLKSQNAGLRMRTVKLWKPKTPECSPLARSVQSVTFFEVAPAVIMFFVGSALAFVILIVERTIYKLYSSKRMAKSVKKKQRTGGKKTLLRTQTN